MTGEELLRYSREEGREEGKEATEDRILLLISKLTEDGRMEDIGALSHNKELLGTLYEEYHL